MTREHLTERPSQAFARRLPATVVLPVLNEELNLPAALASVAWADEVVVIGSGSTDRRVCAAYDHARWLRAHTSVRSEYGG
jgi:hypothetical protein